MVNKVPIDNLKDRLRYEEKSGKIYWIKGKRVSQEAGCVDRKYIRIRFGKERVRLQAHRVAWALYYDEWPPDDMMLDHIDGVGTNNRIENLRLATNSQNQTNRLAHNVSQRKNGKWRASFWLGPKHMHFGYYTTKEEALMVADNKRKEFHGEFYHRAS